MRVLVDTSAWIHALKKEGKEQIRLSVKNCLDDGLACLCQPVLIELWNGARGPTEKRMLQELQTVLEVLPTSEEAWSLAYRLAARTRSRGITVPAIDILIFSIALVEETNVLHDDSHFEKLAGLEKRQLR